jgi:predicted DNA-binding protein (MmcQ/YjbR family)
MAVVNPLRRIRKLCLSLPGAHEVEAWGEPTFRVKNKIFAMYAAADNHHGKGRPAIWVKAAPGNQELMIAARPERYFIPPYVGPSGWIGMWLDKRPNWKDAEELLADAHVLLVRKSEDGRRKTK